MRRRFTNTENYLNNLEDITRIYYCTKGNTLPNWGMPAAGVLITLVTLNLKARYSAKRHKLLTLKPNP